MIRYFNQDIDFQLKHKRLVSSWLKHVIEAEHRKQGQVNIIFCSDKYILDINRRFLNHDYYTDIITFDYCEGDMVSGDLFISVDTVRDNSIYYKTDVSDELDRVMVHGILHLAGYDDHTVGQQKQMRSKENHYLQLRVMPV